MKRLINENIEISSRRLEIRRHLVEYLRTGFPYRMHWQHPFTGEVHTYETVERAVLMARKHYPKQYKVLWSIWMSPERWREVCRQYDIPPQRYSDYFDQIADHIVFWLYQGGRFQPEEEEHDRPR